VRQKEPWFAVKQHGYGVGRPISWEGWLVISAYAIVAVAAGLLLPPKGFFLVVVLGSVALLYICRHRSDDGWRYRNDN
jgi:hypothetical protein